jgi:hypothetical protein
MTDEFGIGYSLVKELVVAALAAFHKHLDAVSTTTTIVHLKTVRANIYRQITVKVGCVIWQMLP